MSCSHYDTVILFLKVRPLPTKKLDTTKLSDLVAEYLENGDASTALGLASSLSSTLNAQESGSDKMSEGQKTSEQVEIINFLTSFLFKGCI